MIGARNPGRRLIAFGAMVTIGILLASSRSEPGVLVGLLIAGISVVGLGIIVVRELVADWLYWKTFNEIHALPELQDDPDE